MLQNSEMRVLLCDDQPIVAEALRQMLSDCAGLSFKHVANQIDLLKVIGEFSPTVLLQDLVLENTSGLDVVRHLRTIKDYSDLPIVLLSTTDDAKVKFEAFSAGANDYVVKFPEQFELLGRIAYHSKAFLTSKQKEQAERMLAQRSRLESLGTLSAGVAHEINTPLQYISSNLDFLKDVAISFSESPDREEMISAIKDCINGTKQIAEIVSAMKAFSHPGKQTASPCNIGEIIRDVSVLSTNEWKDHATLEVSCPENLSPIPCVRGALAQALLNLLVNAAHATKKREHKSGKLKIVVEDSPNELVICVSDNGTGIPADVQVRMYDPFFTTKGVGVGSGQGLGITRSIIEETHHGVLSFETAMEIGTTFRISLPKCQPI